MRVSVIGGSTVDEETYDLAVTVGRELAEAGHTVVCGGLSGVMEAACRGAHETGGTTIGILAGDDLDAANAYVDVPIATGLGSKRNALVVGNGEAAIAIDGSYGTLSEIALALDAGIPVVGLDTHDVDGITRVDDATAAVEAVERLV